MNKITEEKIVVITGSTRGIGLAIAKKFSSEGYKVVLNSSNSDGSELAEGMSHCIYIKADISKQSECKHLIHETMDKFGKIDVLINNAGIFIPQKNMLEKDRIRMFKIKLGGIQYCSDYAIRHGVQNIVNISSIYAHKPEFNALISSALQAGVENLTLNYAKQFSGKINVNAIAPGYVDTLLVRKNISQHNLDKIVEGIPIKRLIAPSEIANIAYFLANTPIITGQIIIADGGLGL
jgi:NAD(P)-dependent dehydrogenase (short-subunit alcohol dehydrogenase family)